MHRIASLLLVLLLTLTATAWGAGRSGIVTLKVDLSAQKAGEPARLWLPYPVSDRQQTIGNLRLAGDFADSGVYTDPVSGTPILYAAWPAEATSRKLTLAFSIDRQEQRVATSAGKEPKWN